MSTTEILSLVFCVRIEKGEEGVQSLVLHFFYRTVFRLLLKKKTFYNITKKTTAT